MSDYSIDELLDRLDEGRGHCGMCGEQAVERNGRGQYICMACLRESTASYDYVLKWDAHAEITRLRADLAEAQVKIERLKDAMEILRENPVAVHLNMLNGNIAKPTWEHIKHLYLAEFSAIPSA